MKFLEKHVQWLALGLGALYLAYMAYAYLGYMYLGKSPPLSVTIGADVLSPGEVDKKIVDKVIVPLEAAMAEKKENKIISVDPAARTILISVVDDRGGAKSVKYNVTRGTVITAVGSKGHLELANLSPGQLVTVQTNSSDTETATAISCESPVVEMVQAAYDELIDENKVNKSALAVNLMSPHQAPGALAEEPTHVVVKTDKRVTLPNPPAAMPGPNYIKWTVLLMPAPKDAAVFAGIFTIDYAKLTAEINQAYADALQQLALNKFMPEISLVQLLRKESSDEGKTWSSPIIIDTLPVNELMKHPGTSKDRQKLFDYKNWMEGHQALILRPHCYPTAKDVEPLPVPAANVAPPAPAPGGAAVPPAVAPPLRAPAQVPPAVVNGAAPPPVVNQDIEILVYDVTAQEGKLYRYAVKYKLFNTLWDHPQATNATIDKIFDVDSVPDPTTDEKYWTEAKAAESTLRVFVTKVNTRIPDVQFAVFTWKKGHWTKSPPRSLTAGDAIKAGEVPTGWTVADVRRDPHVSGGNAADAWYVLIMDDRGQVYRRDVSSDMNSKELAELEKLAAQAGAAAAAGSN